MLLTMLSEEKKQQQVKVLALLIQIKLHSKMAGNEQIMKMLASMQAQMKASEDKRQEERDEDKKELKEMSSKIESGIDEMKQIIKPWEERTAKVEEKAAIIEDKVEKLTKELLELKEMKVKEMQEKERTEKESLEREKEEKMQREEGRKAKELNDKEVKELRERVDKLQQRPEKTYANVAASGIESKQRVGASEDNLEKERKLFRAAKCVIGLKPIEKKHVEEKKRELDEAGTYEGESFKDWSDDDKMTDAKMKAAEDFMRYEMKMNQEDIDRIKVLKVFTTTKADWNTVYVTLRNEKEAQFVMSFTQYMRKGVEGEERTEVVKYIPKELFKRFKAITRIGNKARFDSDNDINFRVSLDKEDFALQFKEKGSKFWGAPVELPEDLPGIEHQIPRGTRSPGEAPGRKPLNLENDRKRERPSSSSSGITPPSKKTSEDNVENSSKNIQ